MLNAQIRGRLEVGKLLRLAGALAVTALMARARVMLDLAPFALALFAAGLQVRLSPTALLLGCVLGSVRFPLSQSDLTLPAGCAILLLGALLSDRLVHRGRVSDTALAMTLAGAGTLLPGLAAARLEAYPSLLALIASAVAVAATPAFCAALAWRPERARDARAPAALALFAVVMGACALWPPGAYFLACAAVLFAADASLGAGAALGALTGCALLSGGGAPVAAVSVCLGGAAAGLLAPRGRVYAAPGFVMAAGLSGLYAPEAFPGPVAPALAALLYIAVPEAWLEALGAALFRAGGERKAREEAVRALGALSAAFGELAAGVANAPDEQALLADMRERLCADCDRYGRCWAGEDDRAVRLMCRMISDAAVFGETRAGEDAVPPEVAHLCRRGQRLTALAQEEVRALRRRRGEEELSAGALFQQAERILAELARTRARPRDAPPRLRADWGASARSMYPGTPSGDAHLARELPDGRILALVCDGMGSGEAAREESERAARLLWKFLAARVEPEAALKAVNALLLKRGAGDMFATVDLCLIDPRRSRAQFWKMAASRSLIARAGELICIEGSRLPLGVIEGVEAAGEEVDLRQGDVIVIGSDGVMEAGEGALEDALTSRTLPPPTELAEEILCRAEAACAPGRRDDMTVMCIRILRARGP